VSEAARSYWNDKIRRWSESCYGEKESAKAQEAQRGPVERLMARLRKSVDARLETASELLLPIAKGHTFLELGCGSGELARRLAEAGAARVEGWDISDEAVALSKRRLDAAGFGDRAVFRRADLNQEAEFPQVDIAVGLGLLDWISLEQVDALASRLRAKHVLFSFSEEDNSLAEIVHRVYLVWRLKRKNLGFGAHHFRRQDVLDIFAQRGWPDAEILKTRAMRFGVILYDLPHAEEEA
jgi:SAM-dependent methyltransferase